jgi:hypothetical protein
MYPTADHKKGLRLHVRWRDENGEQQKLNRPKRGGRKGEKDPEIYAEALDAQIRNELNTDDYVDPASGDITLEAFAKDWRSALGGNPSTEENIDKRLAHIYDVEAGPRTRRAAGTSLIAGRSMSDLSKNPHAIQQWIKSLERKGLAPRYIKHIVDTLSSIFIAAIDNGIVKKNPTKADSVTLPTIPKKRIVPWAPEKLAEARGALLEQDRVMSVSVSARRCARGRSSGSPKMTWCSSARGSSRCGGRSSWWRARRCSRCRSATRSGTCRCRMLCRYSWPRTSRRTRRCR